MVTGSLVLFYSAIDISHGPLVFSLYRFELYSSFLYFPLTLIGVFPYITLPLILVLIFRSSIRIFTLLGSARTPECLNVNLSTSIFLSERVRNVVLAYSYA